MIYSTAGDVSCSACGQSGTLAYLGSRRERASMWFSSDTTIYLCLQCQEVVEQPAASAKTEPGPWAAFLDRVRFLGVSRPMPGKK